MATPIASRLRTALKNTLALASAALVAFVISSALLTQDNLARLAGMGADISARIRLETTLHDLWGMLSSYFVLILLAFALAWPVILFCARRLPAARLFWFAFGGATSVYVLHAALHVVTHITVIASVRTPLGLLGQTLAGAFGMIVLGWLTRPSARRR
ncbi:MAG: hypothetical protein AAF610_03630 [Pseudomonadota bacterium]